MPSVVALIWASLSWLALDFSGTRNCGESKRHVGPGLLACNYYLVGIFDVDNFLGQGHMTRDAHAEGNTDLLILGSAHGFLNV